MLAGSTMVKARKSVLIHWTPEVEIKNTYKSNSIYKLVHLYITKKVEKRLKKMFRPAFGCCKHPKAGRNTQQSFTSNKSWDYSIYFFKSKTTCVLPRTWITKTWKVLCLIFRCPLFFAHKFKCEQYFVTNCRPIMKFSNTFPKVSVPACAYYHFN